MLENVIAFGYYVNTKKIKVLNMTKRDPQLNIRLPSELKDRLTAIAKRNNRSVNAEAVSAIESAVSRAEQVVIHENGDVDITLSPLESHGMKVMIESVKRVNELEEGVMKILELASKLDDSGDIRKYIEKLKRN